MKIENQRESKSMTLKRANKVMPNHPKNKYIIDEQRLENSSESVANGIPVSKEGEGNSQAKSNALQPDNIEPLNKNLANGRNPTINKNSYSNSSESSNSFNRKEKLKRDLTDNHIANMIKESPSDLKDEILSTP